MEDTIAAISTSLGIGAISIIRISGNKSINIINKIFSKNLKKEQSHTVHYGYIKKEDKILDEVLVTIMKAPKTFTTEDTIEITCHGGIITTKEVLDTILEAGARLAEPGEFTKRAFLNGRIDLIKAESIMDIIEAKTKTSADLALNGLTGNTSKKISYLRKQIFKLIGTIEVNIDYPEYDDVEVLTNEKLLPEIKKIKEYLNKILEESNTGKLIKEGIKVVIIGKPNVGKSSILNRLLDEEKAIVTNIAGTTRDIVEGSINLDGVLLNIVDTAGIRKTKNIVEKLGVEKSLKEINTADLVLFIIDNNNNINKEELELLSKIKTKKIVTINKIDLETKIDTKKIKEEIIVKIDTISNNGINNLKEKIIELFKLEEIKTKELNYLSNSRQIALIKKALNHLVESEKSIKNKKEVDLIEIDLKEVWDILGEVVGESYNEDLIDEMFKNFCLGK